MVSVTLFVGRFDMRMMQVRVLVLDIRCSIVKFTNIFFDCKVTSKMMCMMCDFSATRYEGGDVSLDGQVVVQKDTFRYLGSVLQKGSCSTLI